MSTTASKDSADSAHAESKPVADVAAWEADQWMDTGLFNWYATFSFDARTHAAYRLDTPLRLYRFVKQELERAGYRGPYVIVPHDNSKTRYYHAHVLLNDYRAGICAGLSDRFRIHGNVSSKDDGPIRGRGAYLYCANRATNIHTGEVEFEERLHFTRRPRPRGSGVTRRRSGVRRTASIGSDRGGTAREI